ncbi:MAG: hypothetical protein NTZ48_03390 [Candidatus Omnitrophica bacterium]|nr:hypothetical protein [Candidatus Omnitrophota bacterium]
MPDFSVDYPAVLHINLDKDYRNLNIGSRLIAIFMDYLARNKVSGVRLATMSDKSAVFFKKQGFNLLYQARRTYFRNLLGKDISVYIYGKIVDNRNYSVI